MGEVLVKYLRDLNVSALETGKQSLGSKPANVCDEQTPPAGWEGGGSLAPGSAGDRLAFKVPREHLSAVSSLLPRPSPLSATGVFALGGSSGSLRWDKCQLQATFA